MQASLSTLQIYERLKKVRLPQAQAREIADILGDFARDHLTTKDDLEKVHLELKNELEKLRMELTADIERSRSSTILWVAGLLMAQAAMIVTLQKLLT